MYAHYAVITDLANFLYQPMLKDYASVIKEGRQNFMMSVHMATKATTFVKLMHHLFPLFTRSVAYWYHRNSVVHTDSIVYRRISVVHTWTWCACGVNKLIIQLLSITLEYQLRIWLQYNSVLKMAQKSIYIYSSESPAPSTPTWSPSTVQFTIYSKSAKKNA